MRTPKLSLFSPKRQAIEDAKKTVLGVVVIAAVITSVSLVSINFLFDLSRYNARVIKDKETAVSTIETNITNVSALVTSFQAFEAGPDLISSQGNKENSSVVLDALPSKYDFPALATTMEALVILNGLKLDSFSGTDESTNAIQSAPQPTPQPINFTIVLAGTYDEIQQFLTELQTTIQPYTVERVKLTGSDQNMRAEMSIKTFYQPSVSLDVETKLVR